MELEVSRQLGAERHERGPLRHGQRNGYRGRDWDTRVGTIELKVPRARDGSYLPGLREPRRRTELALLAMMQETYVQECRRAEWTTWCRHWDRPGSRVVRCRGLAGSSTARSSACGP